MSKFQIPNSKFFVAVVTLVFLLTISFNPLLAQTNVMPINSENINSSAFRLTVCDGPAIPSSAASSIPTDAAEFKAKFGHDLPYVPCDFKGLMMQIQHLINIAIIGGVLLAVGLFTYAGFLYVRGGKHVDEAKKIFPKVFWGFIIMLSAWFIVYQLLNWLTGSNVFGVLLGQP